MTMKSVSKYLQPITYYRKYYYTPGYAGMIDRQQRIGLVVADVENGDITNISDYPAEGGKSEKHYYMRDCVDITDIIIDWMNGEYDHVGVTARESSIAARKSVIRDIIERCAENQK